MYYPNRRERRKALFAPEHKQNNRSRSRGRGLALAPRYTEEEINAKGITTIERLRRMRCLKNIKLTYA